MAEQADARDSKSREVTPHVGSTPTFGNSQETFGPLLTERLRLRRYVEGDAELIHRLMSDPRVMQYFPGAIDLERAKKTLDNILASYLRFGYSVLALERRSDGAYLGQIGLLHWDDVDGRQDVEVAYMLLPEHWGHGYATEAAQACQNWAFEHLGVDRVVSFIAVRNQPSIGVAERNGMQRSKRLEHNRFGQPVYVYCITRAAWAGASKGRR